MAKKSFFERLVGATEGIRGTQTDDEIRSLTKINFEEPKKTRSSTKQVDLPRQESRIIKPQTETKKKIVPKETKSELVAEEWSSGEEGQLTIDVYQTDSDIVIKSTIAGVKPENIDISITDNMVTIKGKRMKDEKIESENYYYQELYWGAFSRSVILPADIDSDKARASIKDGILTIRLPKTERLKTKTIKVREIE